MKKTPHTDMILGFLDLHSFYFTSKVVHSIEATDQTSKSERFFLVAQGSLEGGGRTFGGAGSEGW